MSIRFINNGSGGGSSDDWYIDNAKNLFSDGVRLNVMDELVGKLKNVTNTRGMFSYCYNITEVPYFDTSQVTDTGYMFNQCNKIKEIPLYNLGNSTDMTYMFYGCSALTKIPQFDTKNVTDMSNAFYTSNLVDMPILNTSKVTNMYQMFSPYNLSEESLNNILIMCINATSYTGTKKLTTLGFASYIANVAASKIQALPKYQEFLDAGWTIGY